MNVETLDLTIPQLNRKLIDAVDAVAEALGELRIRNARWVEAERDHRLARALARPRIDAKLAADREDQLFLRTRQEWFEAEMADTLRATAKEALRASMAILNGIQSVAAAHREEARLSTYGEQRSA